LSSEFSLLFLDCSARSTSVPTMNLKKNRFTLSARRRILIENLLYRRNRLLTISFIILLLSFCAAQLDLPTKWKEFIGDSAVYYSMSESLAWDFDLNYSRNDLIRITKNWATGPQGMLLVADDKHPEIVHYAKPILYPLVCSILVRFFSYSGMIFLNLLCFVALIFCGVMSYPHLAHRKADIFLWNLCFWGLTVFPAYIFSLTPDLFNCAFVMIGLIPWIILIRNDCFRLSASMFITSAVLLGLAKHRS
jgi:hypothetical protein